MTESTQFGFVYWHTQSYSPVMKWGVVYPIPLPPPLSVRHLDLAFPNYDIFGLYGNIQLLSLPGVVRTEIAYSPNKSFNTFNDLYYNGVVRRNWLKYMIAYDLAGYFYFSSWHPTSSFDITIEHVGEWIPNAHHYDLEFSSDNTNLQTYTASFNMRIGTSWLYGKFTTDFIVGYSTFGNSGLLLPHIGYVPGWFDKNLTFDLKYYRIYGESYYEGMGIMRGKNVLMLTTQFSF